MSNPAPAAVNPASTLTNWSYTGMDPAADHQIAFTEATVAPALVVWMTITTNPAYQIDYVLGGSTDNWQDSDMQKIVDSTGMTVACANYIRASISRAIVTGSTHSSAAVTNAFEIVARAFHNMGAEFTTAAPAQHLKARATVATSSTDYMPQNCPLSAALVPIGLAAALPATTV